MSERRRALGRGLGALISSAGSASPRAEQDSPPVTALVDHDEGAPTGTRWLSVDLVDPNPDQPRRVFDADLLEQLAASILEHGVLQPVVVRPAGERFELIVGERRWRACRAAGLKELPAVIADMAPASRLEVAIVENVQRDDLNPIELAYAFRALGAAGATQEEIGRKVSLDRSSVANHMRLLDLTPDFQEDVEQGRLSMGHAKALLQVGDLTERRQLRDRVVRQELSVRATEKAARGGRPAARRGAGGIQETAPADPDLQRVIDSVQRRFQSRVRLKGDGQKGHVEIDYFNEDDLTRIMDLLLGSA